MGVVIDSSVFIALERRGLRPSDIVLITEDAEILISSITVSELFYGVHRANSTVRRERREQFINELLAMVPVLSFDEHVARLHAEILATMTAAGQLIGSHDVLIAATALFWKHEILTANMRDFSRVPNLVARQPIWPST